MLPILFTTFLTHVLHTCDKQKKTLDPSQNFVRKNHQLVISNYDNWIVFHRTKIVFCKKNIKWIKKELWSKIKHEILCSQKQKSWIETIY